MLLYLICCFYLLGMNFSPIFPSNFGDFSQNISTPTEQQQPLAQNPSGKTEYTAFPKPFESSSSIGAEKQRYFIVNIIHYLLKRHLVIIRITCHLKM